MVPIGIPILIIREKKVVEIDNTILYLSHEDVISTGIGPAEAFETAEEVLLEHSKKYYQNPPKPSLYLSEHDFIDAMPAYLPGLNAVGIKWLSAFSSNHKRGLRPIQGLIILNDVTTGQPVTIMDCGYITALRTAAVSAVAAKYRSDPKSAVMGIIGAGTQARAHLQALKRVLKKIECIKVYDINEVAAHRFASTMGEGESFQVKPVGSAEMAIRDSDVVLTATGNLMGKPPIFMEKWLKRGSHIIPVHNYGWEWSALMHADKLVVDDYQQYSTTFHIDSYNPHLPPCYSELSAIVAGLKKGRERTDEVIVSLHAGIALQDIALATKVYAAAKANDIGKRLLF